MSTLLAFVLVFGTIVFFHELGHFVIAKVAGVKVYEFALGFGPAVVRREIGETNYSIRVLPLGGFVKLAGMDEAEEGREMIPDDDPRSFNNKPLPWRMGTIAAGPLMNFLFAVVLFAAYFMLVVVPPTITLVEPASPAEQAGLQPGDQFVMIDGQKIRTTQQVVDLVQDAAAEEMTITVRRGDQIVDVRVVPSGETGQGRLGVQIDEKPQLPLLDSIIAGFAQTGHVTRELVVSLVRMITGRMQAEIAGPIGIFQIVGETAGQGIAQLLLLAAILNINLGLLNFLPVPVLDGGWLVILAVEGIRGRPLKPEHRGLAQFIGLALLILLMVFATYKDIARLDIFS